MITLIKLQQEGKLQKGDCIFTKTLGNCTVVSIHSSSEIQVVDCMNNFYTLSGINFGSDARMVQHV